MNSALTRSARAITLVELLIALTIAMAFLSGVYATFIHVVRAHDTAEAREQAAANGRVALSTLSEDFKEVNTMGPDVFFMGIDGGLDYGDGIDNDGDGLIDEEIVDGLNESPTPALAADRHARIGDRFERPQYVDREDLGDRDVDVGRSGLRQPGQLRPGHRRVDGEGLGSRGGDHPPGEPGDQLGGHGIRGRGRSAERR
ncbi:MAG TPA: prepilin-type N-terminal cleavage/methylation domain-containing protein, partial [Candidatus Sumerlaeota bacterium]|nr:prepilin-type N-terminal cleavage/methylation domain-containing protein [Candidatus Sumerlaeota bacterium]